MSQGLSLRNLTLTSPSTEESSLKFDINIPIKYTYMSIVTDMDHYIKRALVCKLRKEKIILTTYGEVLSANPTILTDFRFISIHKKSSS